MSYRGHLADNTSSASAPEMLCDARNKIKLKTFTKDNEMFKRPKLDRFFPSQPLLENKFYNSCAVVSRLEHFLQKLIKILLFILISGGSLHKSGLGSFIDSHDLVLRFNNAPTDKHEDDVGSKTHIRIVNSQVVAKPQFRFLEDSFYSKVET